VVDAGEDFGLERGPADGLAVDLHVDDPVVARLEPHALGLPPHAFGTRPEHDLPAVGAALELTRPARAAARLDVTQPREATPEVDHPKVDSRTDPLAAGVDQRAPPRLLTLEAPQLGDRVDHARHRKQTHPGADAESDARP